MRLTISQRAPGAPDSNQAELVAISGAPLRLARDAIVNILREGGCKDPHGLIARPGACELDEAPGVRLALLMYALKPLRKRSRIRTISEAIAQMSPEATCYWFAKAHNGWDYHTRRRHLRALRILLAEE